MAGRGRTRTDARGGGRVDGPRTGSLDGFDDFGNRVLGDSLLCHALGYDFLRVVVVHTRTHTRERET